MYKTLMKTSDELIEATRDLLWERGFLGTSPKDIQKRAGAGQGSMYHHFAGKHELAFAAIERSADELLRGIDEQFNGPGTALARVTNYLTREREVLKGCPIGRLTHDAAVIADMKLCVPVEIFFATLRQRIGSLLKQAQVSGELVSSLDPDALSCAIIAIMQGGYVLARAARSEEPYDQAIRGVVALLDLQKTPPR